MGLAYYKKECKVVLKNENRPSRGGFHLCAYLLFSLT